jgi:hypothetical protein
LKSRPKPRRFLIILIVLCTCRIVGARSIIRLLIVWATGGHTAPKETPQVFECYPYCSEPVLVFQKIVLNIGMAPKRRVCTGLVAECNACVHGVACSMAVDAVGAVGGAHFVKCDVVTCSNVFGEFSLRLFVQSLSW